MSNIDSVLLRVITSTRRKLRLYNLVEISDDVKTLIKHYGSSKEASDIIGISPAMLNQFLKIDKVSPKIFDLVDNRVIDSVSIVNSLSKLSTHDQDVIADYITNGKLNSLDIRFLIPLIKNNPNQPLERLIIRLKDSENIKVSVIKFPSNFSLFNSKQIKRKFEDLVGVNNLISVDINDQEGVVKLTPEGEKALRNKAKDNKETLSAFVEKLLS